MNTEDDFQVKIAKRMEMEKLARKLLGVSATAEVAELRKAFWLLAMKYHPDKNPKDEETLHRFTNLVNAYDFLLRGSDSRIRLSAEEENLIGKYKDNEWGFFCNWRENFMDDYFPGASVKGEARREEETNCKADNPFEHFAERYDYWFEVPKNRLLFEAEVAVLKHLMGKDREAWLEVGVGTGRFAEALGIQTGIDPSKSMLHLAQARGIQTHCASGEALPYAEMSFSGILMVVTLCFLSAPKQVFAECNRVLKPKGALIVGFVPAGTSWQEFYSRKADSGHPFYRHAKFYTCDQVMQLADAAGFVAENAASTLFNAPGESTTQLWKPELVASAGFVGMKFVKNSTV
ncbi:MAG: methyltransferase domain-containing protein [Planctomycetes bacterium]|nr:methyltransferase domain-containing protein [Planctomycetota bacterium]